MIPESVHTLGAPPGHRRISFGPRARFSFLTHRRSLMVSGIALLVVLVGSVAPPPTVAYLASPYLPLAVLHGQP